MISPEECRKLVATMPKRIAAVFQAKGGVTKYWKKKTKTLFSI